MVVVGIDCNVAGFIGWVELYSEGFLVIKMFVEIGLGFLVGVIE